MFVLATPIVDWTAMWKICLVALAAGAGVVVFFGFMLLGLKFAHSPATHGAPDGGTDDAHGAGTDRAPSAGARLGGFTLSLVCGLVCVGVIAVGVYAMTKKPSSKPAKPKTALVIPGGSRVRLIASSR
ncbi:MAG: hypothetical protein JO262_04760 [Solirubrobacterales bacterium]|nr:hypothetical protein [Solirubrobacterales bacterium]MBV9941422.1 hypothetical protein [Solirubrobacterales bacterium]